MKQTNHALTFLQAHYRAIFYRALRSGSAWTSVATVALTSAVAATPMVPSASIAAQPVAETTADAASYQPVAAASYQPVADCASAYIQVEPGSPVVHVPTFTRRPYGFDADAPVKFFDLAQDGSPLSHDRDLNANVLSAGSWANPLFSGASVFNALARDAAQAGSAVPVVSDATLGASDTALNVSDTFTGVSDATSGAGDAQTNAAVTTVAVGVDGTITLTDYQGAVMLLRPNSAQAHRYSVVTGAYELLVVR